MKKVLCAILFSACSFSALSQVSPLSLTPGEKVYSDLNQKINDKNNSDRKTTFDKFYNTNSKSINKKVYDFVKSDKYVSSNYLDSKAKEENKLLDEERLISSFYLKQGFIDEAESQNVLAKNAEDIYNEISSSVLDSNIKAILDGKKRSDNNYNYFFDYNKLGILVSSYHIISDINSCTNKDQECSEKIVNKRKDKQSDDIFENLTNQCISESDMGSCRRNVIQSDTFQRQINYNNYLLGSSMFDYYKSLKKEDFITINNESVLGEDCAVDSTLSKDNNGEILLCSQKKWIKK